MYAALAWEMQRLTGEQSTAAAKQLFVSHMLVLIAAVAFALTAAVTCTIIQYVYPCVCAGANNTTHS